MKIIWCMVPEIWSATDIIFSHFRPFFAVLPHLQPEKSKLKKKNTKKKKRVEIYYFTQVYQKSWSYAIPFLRFTFVDECNCYFSFWAIFWAIFFLKWEKRPEISLYTCLPKIMIRWCTIREIWCTTDGWTDGRTDGKCDIERWIFRILTIN